MSNDLARQRAVVLDARFRFAPSLQPVKASAIDSIVQQVLFVAGDGARLTTREIQEQFASVVDGFRVDLSDIRNALWRLSEQCLITPHGAGGGARFQLTEEARKRVAATRDESESLFNQSLNALFQHCPGGPRSYSDPFLLCISTVMYRFIVESIQWIADDGLSSEVDQPLIDDAIRITLDRFQLIDRRAFRFGVARFFRETTPEFTSIKWNLAQNYFVMRAIGMHEGSRLLSSELFAGSHFYLDTNVLIDILDQTSAEHHAFCDLIPAATRAGITVHVCRPHLAELENWVETQSSMVLRVNDAIPESLLPDVDSIFLDRRKALSEAGNPNPGIAEIQGLFNDPATHLVTIFGIEIEEDPWFSDPRHERAIEDFTTTLVNRPLEYRRERKRRGSARVDATVLMWLDEKVPIGERHWLVTLDRSLPGTVPKGSPVRSLAILFPALLLWISPYTSDDTDDDCVPEAFVRLLAERLLPPERLFGLNDFRILQDMGVQVHSMSPDDVRDLILVLRSTAGGLDTTDATDREKLAHEIEAFLVDPATRQHQELMRLSKENQSVRAENSRLKEAQERLEVNTESKLENLADQREKDREEFQRQLQAIRDTAERERETAKENEQRRILRYSAFRRLGVIALLLLIIQFAVGWAVISWLPGQGRMQNIIDAWPLFPFSGALVLVFGWLYLGRDRLAMLPWGIGKLFRFDER